jgi:hypothetical protein
VLLFLVSAMYGVAFAHVVIPIRSETWRPLSIADAWQRLFWGEDRFVAPSTTIQVRKNLDGRIAFYGIV